MIVCGGAIFDFFFSKDKFESIEYVELVRAKLLLELVINEFFDLFTLNLLSLLRPTTAFRNVLSDPLVRVLDFEESDETLDG